MWCGWQAPKGISCYFFMSTQQEEARSTTPVAMPTRSPPSRGFGFCPRAANMGVDPVHNVIVAHPCGSSAAIFRIPRTSILYGPQQDSQTSCPGRGKWHRCVPRAAVGPRPLDNVQMVESRAFGAHRIGQCGAAGDHRVEDGEMSMLGGLGKNFLVVARTTVGARPTQYAHMATSGGARARPWVPRTSLVTQPLYDVEVAACGRACARPFVPRTAVGVQPRKDAQPAFYGRSVTGALVPRTSIGASPLE